MASKGRTVEGTDGTDHIHRETIVKQYYVSYGNHKFEIKQSFNPTSPAVYEYPDTPRPPSAMSGGNPVPFENASDEFSDDLNLPLAGDYVGLGGPEAVPRETEGPFLQPSDNLERPVLPAGSLLDQLFLKPDSNQIGAARRAYQSKFIAQTKSKLKWANILHYLLGFIMLAKLLPAILDKLDIFVMELEELFIPKPDLWEWVWLGSLLATIPAFMASKKSNVAQMRVFQVLLVAAGFLPLLVGAATHFSGAYAFITSEKSTKVLQWRGLPVSILWYGFIIVALQAHAIQTYFSSTLISAWQPKKKRQ